MLSHERIAELRLIHNQWLEWSEKEKSQNGLNSAEYLEWERVEGMLQGRLTRDCGQLLDAADALLAECERVRELMRETGVALSPPQQAGAQE